MRIATYNLNNLFERPKVLEQAAFSPVSRKALEAYAFLTTILPKKTYTATDKAKLEDILTNYAESTNETKFIAINEVRGKLYKFNASTKKVTIVANGRADWLGWPELITKEVNEVATQNTARVIAEVKADILCTVEIEDRTALEDFNKYLLKNQYRYSMMIDGNDERGIDVGLYSNHGIEDIKSHIFDTYTGQDNKEYRIFSRDCAVYDLKYKSHKITLLCNHFKSKGYGSQVSNDKKRKLQATRVAEILKGFDLKKDFVVVAGDFNDTPTSTPLASLLGLPDMHNVVLGLPQGQRGTYLNKVDEQIDYLLVSTGLMKHYKAVGIERRGIFTKEANGKIFDTVKNPLTQASDHAAVWADFNLF
jgi:endonuclease/exonuclease/phosphatase family metal-dependent hydrolase